MAALNPLWNTGDVPEHPANSEPSDWNQIEDWAYPNSAAANSFASLAAVAEMADRLHENRWDTDLSDVLVGGTATPTPTATATSTPSITATSTPTSGSIPPLYVFYVIHTQIGEDYYPYTSPDLTTINPVRMRNMTALVKSIRHYRNENICADDPDGDFLLVDHVGADWMRGSDGRFVQVLTDDDFAVLQNYLNGALTYMADNCPTRLAAWGFVSHISEYTPKNDATALPSQDALDALDRFLIYLEQKKGEGRVVFSNVSVIADATEGVR